MTMTIRSAVAALATVLLIAASAGPAIAADPAPRYGVVGIEADCADQAREGEESTSSGTGRLGIYATDWRHYAYYGPTVEITVLDHQALPIQHPANLDLVLYESRLVRFCTWTPTVEMTLAVADIGPSPGCYTDPMVLWCF